MISTFLLLSRIRALYTGDSDGLEGFKAHAVFQEINKKLLEVIVCLGLVSSLRLVCCGFDSWVADIKHRKNGTQFFSSWHSVVRVGIGRLDHLMIPRYRTAGVYHFFLGWVKC